MLLSVTILEKNKHFSKWVCAFNSIIAVLMMELLQHGTLCANMQGSKINRTCAQKICWQLETILNFKIFNCGWCALWELSLSDLLFQNPHFSFLHVCLNTVTSFATFRQWGAEHCMCHLYYISVLIGQVHYCCYELHPNLLTSTICYRLLLSTYSNSIIEKKWLEKFG